MSSDTTEKKIRVHKADTQLQIKVGTGPLDERAVERCQDVMDSNKVDFTPLAMEYLDRLENAIKEAKSDSANKEEATQNITTPVMQLKANASTFHYNLIGNLANVMLSFLESIEKLDEDAVSIVEAHHQTLKAIIVKKISGDGGPVGKQMEEELKSACKRYFAKRSA